jgi:hypothetical protein
MRRRADAASDLRSGPARRLPAPFRPPRWPPAQVEIPEVLVGQASNEHRTTPKDATVASHQGQRGSLGGVVFVAGTDADPSCGLGAVRRSRSSRPGSSTR